MRELMDFRLSTGPAASLLGHSTTLSNTWHYVQNKSKHVSYCMCQAGQQYHIFKRSHHTSSMHDALVLRNNDVKMQCGTRLVLQPGMLCHHSQPQCCSAAVVQECSVWRRVSHYLEPDLWFQ